MPRRKLVGLHDNTWRSKIEHPENSYESKMAITDYLAGDYSAIDEIEDWEGVYDTRGYLGIDNISENYPNPFASDDRTFSSPESNYKVIQNEFLKAFKAEIFYTPIWIKSGVLFDKKKFKESYNIRKEYYEVWKMKNIKELDEFKKVVKENGELKEKIKELEKELKELKKEGK